MGWETYYTDDDTPYYYNRATGETSWTPPKTKRTETQMGTQKGRFETQMGTFTLTQTCDNRDLIETLKENKKLNTSVHTDDYLLTCNRPFQNNSNIDLLGTGTFGTGYSYIKDNNEENVEVIKITHNSESVLKNLGDEEQGFFIQSYFKKIKCKNICEVYEFGRYTFSPKQEFINSLQSVLHMKKEKAAWIKNQQNIPYLYEPENDKGERYVSQMYTQGVYARIEFMDTTLDKYLKTFNEGLVQSPIKITNEEMKQIQKIFYGILDGLHCMNKMGYVHLDIKPANIGLVIDPDAPTTFMAKLFDFGLATHLNDTTKVNVAGTVVYIDPNFFKSRHFSLNSDVYAVGIILFEFFTGTEVPIAQFSIDSFNSINQNIIKQLKSQRLQNLIRGCLQLDPQTRFSAKDAMNCSWFNGYKYRKVWITNTAVNKYNYKNILTDEFEEEEPHGFLEVDWIEKISKNNKSSYVKLKPDPKNRYNYTIDGKQDNQPPGIWGGGRKSRRTKGGNRKTRRK